MTWTLEDDDAFAELMEEYPRIEPAIERMTRQDAEIAELRERLDRLEAKLPAPKPPRVNTLLIAVKEQRGIE